MQIITRYANRKLYSKETRKYVTLNELRVMIRQGDEVEVIDHQTGEDITTATLSQIIFDQERKIGILPKPVLQKLIRAGEEAVHNLQDGLSAFMNPNQFIEREISIRLSILHEQGVLDSDEKERLTGLLLAPEFSIKETTNAGSGEGQISLDSLQSLLDRIEYIEAELAKIDSTEE